jgi:FKBP-type peptidyl-prolyl cis-trans isomerase 2
MALVVWLLALAACSQASPTAVPTPTVNKAATDGDRVSVNYTGTLDSGEEFDSSRDRGPLSFVLGAGEMIAGFDAAVYGMKVGDSKTVRMESKDAYGESRDDLIIEFPIAQLPQGLAEGDSVLFQDSRQGVILEVTAEKFVVDVNHRLAGQALTFEIELVSIE